MKISLTKEDFNIALEKLKKDYRIFAPKLLPFKGTFSDTPVIRYEEINSFEEICFDQKSDFSPKEVLLPITQRMFYFTENDYKEFALKHRKDIFKISDEEPELDSDGNVVKKHRLASLSSDDIAVKALDEVMPERISIENIGISFGMKWIPDTIYQSFLRYLTDDEKASVKYHLIANTYDIVLNPSIGKESIYGTEQYSLFKILDKLINSITIRVNKTVLDHLGHEKRVLDETATEAAIEQAEIIKAEFLMSIFPSLT